MNLQNNTFFLRVPLWIKNIKINNLILGGLFSEDDFYLTSAGLAATETSLFIYDKNLWKNLSPEGVVYEPIRVMVANRLSEYGSQWAKTFEKHNRFVYICLFLWKMNNRYLSGLRSSTASLQ